MQQSQDCSEDSTIVLPRYTINLARRMVQLLAGVDAISVQLIGLGDAWYLVGPGGKLERL